MRKIVLSVLIGIGLCVLADKPPFQGELNITDVTEYDPNVSYKVVGTYSDLSVMGYDGTNISVGDMIFTETTIGDVDAWTITNIINAGVNVVTVDVAYAQSGTSAVGMIVGYAAICSLSTNAATFPQQPSSEFAHLSDNMLNQIRNYSLRRITAGSGSGDVAAWSGYNATQQIVWVETEILADTNTLSVTGPLEPDASGVYTNDCSENQFYWRASDSAFHIGGNGGPWYLTGPPDYLWDGTNVAGDASGYYAANQNCTGTATVAYGLLTNYHEWRAGWDSTAGAWQITRAGVVNQAFYSGSNILSGEVVIGGVGRTNWPTGADVTTLSNSVEAISNFVDGATAGNSNLSLAIGLGATNYAEAIGAGASNYAAGIGVVASNAVQSISVTGPVTGALTFEGTGVTQTGTVFNFNAGSGEGGGNVYTYSNQWYTGGTTQSFDSVLVSNAVVWSPTNTSSSYALMEDLVSVSNAALPRSGGTATNLSAVSFAFTGNASSNGSVFVATNATGQGGWKRGRTSFLAIAPATIKISVGGVSNLVFATVSHNNSGLTYSDTTGKLTLPLGRWMIYGSTCHLPNDTGFLQPLIEKNDSALLSGPVTGGEATGYWTPGYVMITDSSDGDDTYNISGRSIAAICTNVGTATLSFFGAEYLGE